MQKTRRNFLTGGLALGVFAVSPRASEQAGLVASPAQLKRAMDSLSLLGESITEEISTRIARLNGNSPAEEIAETERLLDRYTLVRLKLDSRGVGKASPGGADPQLAELGWRSFLIQVENPSRVTGPLVLAGEHVTPEGDLQPGIHESHILGNDLPEIVRSGPDAEVDYGLDVTRWLGYRFGSGTANEHGLEGLPIEYCILQIYSHLGGSRAALLKLGSTKLASYSRLLDSRGFVANFNCKPANSVALNIRDHDGQATMASLVIHDEAGRLYPPPAHRLEPDLGYQPQIYRADGETVRLPAGRYKIVALRGPEYLECHRDLVVTSGQDVLNVDLKRWIEPAKFGWYSGDPHVHPEGQHYGIVSKYGVTPETMARQIQGEGLHVGSILIWTGGYYYEKQFLTGHVYEPTYRLPFEAAQHANNVSLVPRPNPRNAESLIRYDVEQAAFLTNRVGHLVLLRLKNHDWPGGKGLYDWPSWNLPILQWVRAEGAVGGYAHIGFGMDVNTDELPNYVVPEMDSLGAQECVVDVAHGAVDFIAGCETPAIAELNLWYHLLNCGFRIPVIGETDFVAGNARTGTGRTYVKLDRRPVGDEGYGAWVEGCKTGRLYFGDGRSHLIGFAVNGQPVSENPLELKKQTRVVLSAKVAARLEPAPLDVDQEKHDRNVASYWHLEQARIGSSRKVPLELIVNGHAVERREVLAGGELQDITFEIDVEQSSWVAFRIVPSSHTAPIFISVGDKPVRASKRSAQWCLDCVDALWEKQAKRIRESERATAAAAWDHARQVYRRIKNECERD